MYSVVSKKIRYGGFEYGRWNYSCDFSGIDVFGNTFHDKAFCRKRWLLRWCGLQTEKEEVLIAEKKDNG